MGKKQDYRAYIQSEFWQNRRRQFLAINSQCAECGLPRYLSVLIFDEDLHVDHKNYQRVGEELDSDLQSLCKRCHEIKHFGHTSLRDPATGICDICQEPMWDRFSRTHEACEREFENEYRMFLCDWDITFLRVASAPARRHHLEELLGLIRKSSPNKTADAATIEKISKEFRKRQGYGEA